jgi:hypothetical protein
MKRSLTLTHSKQSAGDGVWMVRLASGNAIHSIAKNTWSVEDRYQITIDENLVANAAVREVQGRRELVISLPSADASIEYYLRW